MAYGNQMAKPKVSISADQFSKGSQQHELTKYHQKQRLRAWKYETERGWVPNFRGRRWFICGRTDSSGEGRCMHSGGARKANPGAYGRVQSVSMAVAAEHKITIAVEEKIRRSSEIKIEIESV